MPVDNIPNNTRYPIVIYGIVLAIRYLCQTRFYGTIVLDDCITISGSVQPFCFISE